MALIQKIDSFKSEKESLKFFFIKEAELFYKSRSADRSINLLYLYI